MNQTFSKLVLLILFFSIFNLLKAQSVDDTGTIDPISGSAIVYFSTTFTDGDSDGVFDASLVLSENPITTWGDYSTSLAYYADGFKVRDGGAFVADNFVAVLPGEEIHIWMSLDVATKTYSTHIKTSETTDPVLIRAGAAYRNQAISTIQRWSALHNPDTEPDFVTMNKVQVVNKVGDIPGGNNALYLPGGANGANSNVAIENLGLTSLPATIEFWYKPEATHAEYAGIFYNRGSSDAGIQYDKWTNNKTLRSVWGSNSALVASNEPVINEWNHVASVIDASGQQTLYINGVATKGSGGLTAYDWSVNTTYIGWDNTVPVNGDASRVFNGFVDEVRIWNTERSAEDLSNNKYSVLNGDEAGLLAYYNFDDLATDATDLTGNGYTGTITGGTYEASFYRDDQDGDGVPDVFDNCSEPNPDQMDTDGDGVGDVCDNCPNANNPNQVDIDEDGIGDVCDTELPSDLDFALYLPGGEGSLSNVDISGLNITSLPYTIEMWVKPEEAQVANAGLIFNRPGNIGFQYTSGWQSTSQSLRYMTTGGNTYGEGTETSDVSVGEWHHLAVIMTETTRTVILDGVAHTENNMFTVDNFTAGKTYLGWDSDVSNRAFKGWMDEVRVWNVAKSADEINNHKFDTLDVANADGLVAYWNFNDRAEGNATDQSPSGLNASITGGSYALSEIFQAMEYVGSDASQPDKLVGANSKNNVAMVLEVQTVNENKPLHLTQFDLSATGTTDLSDITNISIYATPDSIFSSNNLIGELGQSLEESDFVLTTEYQLGRGNNYFWITVDIAESATKDHVIDLRVNEITISDSAYIPDTVSPVGQLTVNPDIFISYTELPTDTVTTTAHSSFEGSNFASFQQDVIVTFNGYQYVTYWKNVSGSTHPTIARKKLPDGEWEDLVLAYSASIAKINDNHQTISMGICPNDGTIHIAYDHHDVPLNYQKSVVGMVTDPENAVWSDASFGAKQDYLIPGTQITPVTYPRFIAKPNGDLIYECRLGQSGNGDSFMWEYSAETGEWSSIGKYIIGTNVSQNAYINGVHYDPNGRMHVSWVWRETPDPQTNHDVYYGYSDDDGRTWYNAAGTQIGTAETNPMTLNTEGLKVITVGKNRGLINQEAQVVDSKGRIHILQSYISDDHPNSNNFWGFRINFGDLRHIYQDESGNWHSDIIAPSARNRSEIAVDSEDNVYVVSGDHRIYFASAKDRWQTWTELDVSKAGVSQNEGFVDRTRLLNDGILSYVYASSANDGRIMISNYKLEIASNDATLANLFVDDVAVSEFDPDTYTYTVELPIGTTTIPLVTAAAQNANAKVEITQASQIPGSAVVLVTAEDKINTASYTVIFSVEKSTDVSLKEIKLDGSSIDGFYINKVNYDIVLFSSSIPEVTAVANDDNATVDISQATELPGSSIVKVTAEDGETFQNYTINFTMEILSANQLSDFSIYPNPARDQFYISASERVQKIEFYDLTGKSVKSFQGHDVHQGGISVSGLLKGVYLLKAHFESGLVLTKQIILE